MASRMVATAVALLVGVSQASLAGKFALVQTKQTFAGARVYCKETFGTDLAVLAEAARTTQMGNKVEYSGEAAAWIGLERAGDGTLKFLDSSMHADAKALIDKLTTTEAKVALTKAGALVGQAAGEKRYFFCAKPQEVEVTPDVTLVKASLSWDNANEYCRREFGSGVASPLNSAQNGQMYTAAKANGGAAWIGANDKVGAWKDYDLKNNLPIQLWQSTGGVARQRCAQIGSVATQKWVTHSCGTAKAPAFFCSERGCPHNCGRCTAWGDPHYTTFDGQVHHFQGRCAYEMVTGFGHDARETVPFDIVGVHRPWGAYAVVDYMLLRLFNEDGDPGAQVELRSTYVQFRGGARLNWGQLYTIDKAKLGREGATVKAYRVGNQIHVDVRSAGLDMKGTDIQLRMQWGVSYATQTYIAQGWQKKVAGLCGYFDNNKANDLAIYNPATNKLDFADGTGLERWVPDLKRTAQTFGDYWIVGGLIPAGQSAATCKAPPKPLSPECLEAAAVKCEVLYKDDGCAEVPEIEYVRECAMDACEACKNKADIVAAKCVSEEANSLTRLIEKCAANNGYEQTVCIDKEMPITRNKACGKVTAKDNVEIVVDFFLNAKPTTWTSLIHIGNSNGERFPGLWASASGTLHAIVHGYNICGSNEPRVAPGAYHTAKLGMYSDGSARLFLNGRKVCEKQHYDERDLHWWPFDNKQFYAADPWHSGTNGKIKLAVFRTWADAQPDDALLAVDCSEEHQVMQAQRCGELTSKANVVVKFDLKLASTPTRNGNILQVGGGRGYGMLRAYRSGNTLQLFGSHQGHGWHHFGNFPLTANAYSAIQVSFTARNNHRHVAVLQDGALKMRREFDWTPASGEAVYAASAYEDPAMGAYVRNLKVYTWGHLNPSMICGMSPPVFAAVLSVAVTGTAAAVFALRRRSPGKVSDVAYGAV